jgi:sugar O-acyltransferase (sialic acid O-acetyltransferase NeuD family)
MTGPGGGPAVLLWGGRSQARIVHQMLIDAGGPPVRFVFDGSLESPYFESAAAFIRDPALLKTELQALTHFVVCIGSEHGFARCRISEFLKTRGLKALDVVHPRSFVDTASEIGEGSLRMPFSVVHKFSRIGRQCVLNTACVVDHECIIGDGVHIMGGASVAGKVEIGDFATLGTNATVLPGLKIGAGAYVGAGAVVIRDVAPYSVAAGNPARHLREKRPEFDTSQLEKLK